MPNKDETHDDWMTRCMGDAEQMKTTPDQSQRVAVCESKWAEHMKQDMPMKEATKQAIVNLKNDMAEVLVYDQIGADPFFGDGISAKKFRDQIKGIKAKTINLRINSGGGMVTEAVAMMSALNDFPGRIEVDVDGIAASAASVLAMTGDVIRMSGGALMMIHEATAGVLGRAGDMRRMAELLDKVNGQLLDAYMTRAKVDRAKMQQMLTDETWMTAQEACGYGLCDSMTDHLSMAASVDLSKFGYKHAPKIVAETKTAFQIQKERLEQLNRKAVASVK